METLKEIVTVIAAIVGAITGLLTLYAKYLDLKKRAARDQEDVGYDEPPPPPRPRPRPRVAPVRPGQRPPTEVFAEELDDEPPPPPRRGRRPDSAAVARARQLVRAPAICLIAVGFLGLGANLFMAGFGFIDEFVTPLGSSSRERQRAAGEASRPAAKGTTDPMLTDKPVEGMYPAPARGPAAKAAADPDDRAAAVMAIVMCLSFAVAAGAAVWAGFNMLQLRSYWLSVAGSVAIMPGACMCCLTGVGVGAWSLVVLFREDVSSAFR